MRHLLVFFVLGALLFGAKTALESHRVVTPSLTVQVRPNASADERERAIDEAVLIEEALRWNGAWIDPVVREQLLSTMRVKGLEAASRQQGHDEDDASLIARALELGLHRADAVTRQRLVFQAEQLLTASAATAPVAEVTLHSYLAAHGARYAQGERISFRQIYLSRARRGDRVTADAEALRTQLEGQSDAEPTDVHGGDATLLPRVMDGADVTSIDARFGPGFAAALASAPVGHWSTPTPSTYGLHLVLIEERVPARIPDLAAVRDRVLADYRHDQRAQLLRTRLRSLRASYRIDLRPSV